MTATAVPPTGATATGRREVAVEGVRFAIDRAEPSQPRKTTPVLLLHGVPQTAAMWRPVIEELARDRVVIAPDLKGLGESEVRGPYDIGTLVDELAALVLHEVDGRIDVVGHDWGGALAIALAYQRPEVVRRLVVINGPYRQIDYARAWHIPFFALPWVPEAVFALTGDQFVKRAIRYGWRSSTPPADEMVERYTEAYADPARLSAMLAYYRGVARPRISRMVRSVVPGLAASPTSGPRAGVTVGSGPERSLVIWGAADPVLPLSVGEAVDRDLGSSSRLVVLPGVGHFTVDEAPGLVAETVAAFLRDGERSRTRSRTAKEPDA